MHDTMGDLTLSHISVRPPPFAGKVTTTPSPAEVKRCYRLTYTSN
jgi:hypothetical protein